MLKYKKIIQRSKFLKLINKLIPYSVWRTTYVFIYFFPLFLNHSILFFFCLFITQLNIPRVTFLPYYSLLFNFYYLLKSSHRLRDLFAQAIFNTIWANYLPKCTKNQSTKPTRDRIPEPIRASGSMIRFQLSDWQLNPNTLKTTAFIPISLSSFPVARAEQSNSVICEIIVNKPNRSIFFYFNSKSSISSFSIISK